MKKTDLGVVGFMYGVCILFFVLSRQFKPAARTYPLFIILLLFSLTSLYVIQMIVGARKNGVTSGVKEIFDGFIPKQFFFVYAMIVSYLVLMYYAGFYISTVLFIVTCLFFLSVPLMHIIIATPAVLLLIYGSFTLFLGVKLPVGLLLK